MPENEEAAPAAEAQQDVAQTSDTKAEAAATAKASDELSVDDLAGVAGGLISDSLMSLDLSSLIGGPLKAPGI